MGPRAVLSFRLLVAGVAGTPSLPHQSRSFCGANQKSNGRSDGFLGRDGDFHLGENVELRARAGCPTEAASRIL